MAIYEYECDKCGYKKEFIVKGFETPKSYPCTECDKGRLKKIMSAAAIVDRANLRIPSKR
jgi:putative FmdB family regulatory protein